MTRQLPALVSEQRSLARVGDPASTMGRVVAALAPDVIRAAERIASQRLQQRGTSNRPVGMPGHTEALHLSEVEIDVSMPFVRRITMRNMTAWNNAPIATPLAPVERTPPRRLRKVGLLGASGVLALGAGLLVRRAGPFPWRRQSIIDVPGRPRT